MKYIRENKSKGFYNSVGKVMELTVRQNSVANNTRIECITTKLEIFVTFLEFIVYETLEPHNPCIVLRIFNPMLGFCSFFAMICLYLYILVCIEHYIATALAPFIVLMISLQ